MEIESQSPSQATPSGSVGTPTTSLKPTISLKIEWPSGWVFERVLEPDDLIDTDLSWSRDVREVNCDCVAGPCSSIHRELVPDSTKVKLTLKACVKEPVFVRQEVDQRDRAAR